MSAIALLFDEAWLRRRHRRRRDAAIWAAAGVLVLGAVILGVGPPASRQSGSAAIRQAPSGALVRSGSYLAIHCPQPNSIACDQLALAVTLKRPARGITATIDGHRWPMNRRGDELYSSARPRREFDGYFSHAGIRSRLHVHPVLGDLWFNNLRARPVEVSVSLLVHLASGRAVSTRLRLYLADGWG
jgi:hypothetical protein